MKQHIGFIGSGNMGTAIIKGLVSSKVAKASQISVFDIQLDKVKALSKEIGINAVESQDKIMDVADIIFLAVKPNIMGKVLSDIKAKLTKKSILVSIAAGVTIDTIEKVIGKGYKIVRIMPNTPALVNMGMSSITPNDKVTDSELKVISTIFDSLGRSEVVPEYLIHSVVGVSGSAPAYVFMFIEAMADAAVLAGMPRAQAYTFAAQTVMGSAKMVMETGKHPGELKDMVCSPGGTTIEAVKVLEEKGFRAAVIDAMISCMDKSEALSNK
ncbi:pyrroline-5-carboxylate reductase [Zophobihabitans entericus]|uniref:Pyrroline-5-carboxylate reductase n=1 Tax=Zophobihabitans entericus TaxID=1635327 RepID=A0A6G9IDH5_9GAMM|nr:pyrroline-5-carboxylate reductase [Zophobihabitans entericus]QIQ21872.1 pyrroline-5-carboxylate reductase [Zophobihabitans entericus]